MDLSSASVAELNAELVRRTAGPEALDHLFTLPPWLDDDALCAGYEIIVARMRREAGHVQMNTVQTLLLERIALNYVVLRYKEALTLGQDGAITDPKVLKDFNTFWLTMTREFNELLVKFRPADKDSVMGLVRQAIEECIAAIDWTGRTDMRNELAMRIVDTFKRYELISA